MVASTPRARARAEAGMTLAEVMIAMLILLVGVGASVTLFPQTERQSQVALRQEKASAIAEREIEKLRGVSFAQLGLASTPTVEAGVDCSETNPLSPTCHLNGSRYRILSSWSNSASAPLPETPAAGEPLWMGGTVVPYQA